MKNLTQSNVAFLIKKKEIFIEKASVGETNIAQQKLKKKSYQATCAIAY